jgi:hypothetical protein
MDIKLNDSDIKDFISNIKITLLQTTKTLRVKTNINYDFLYNTLVIFPNDLINIIHEYTQNQYIIKYTLSNQYWSVGSLAALIGRTVASDTQIRKIKINFINICNTLLNDLLGISNIIYTINMSCSVVYNIQNYNYGFILCNKDTDNLLVDIVFIGGKQIQCKKNMSLNEESLCMNDLICSTLIPNDVILVLIFVVNNLFKLMLSEH